MAAREMVTLPDSSGSRMASNADLGNSGSSSRNKTPWCAKEISPGRGGEPPPTKATALAEWCGCRVGRRDHCARSNPPARLAIDAASKASVILRGPSSPAKRCASMDLPEPGGPIINKLWPPAAAISSARFAPAWPLTSAMSSVSWDAGVGKFLGGNLDQPCSSGGLRSCCFGLGIAN